jgi:hypothetical protein
MDAQRGAMAYYDYDKAMDQLIILNSPAKKYLQNSNIFPQGTYVTRDARWEIPLNDSAAQARFGWRGGPAAMTGKGLLSFSAMIANARQFQTCMAQRTVAAFCERNNLRDVLPNPEFIRIANGFRDDGYKMKTLIRKIVTSEVCK